MKEKVFVFVLCVGILLVLAGCGEVNKVSGNVEEAGLSDNNFPGFLVGSWMPRKDDNNRWIFTFTEDGSISKFRHFVGMEFDVSKGGLVENWHGGAEAMYGLGQCEAKYDEQTRQLTVTIVIEDYLIKFPDGSMEGSFHDYLSGPVSEDGTTWKASWTAKSEIIGSGVSQTGPKILTFTKIDEQTK